MKTFLKSLILLFVIFTQFQLYAQDTKFLSKLLKKEKSLDSILTNPNLYDIQIIYTAIDRSNNKIKFNDYYYKVNSNNYFYPSTTVLLPAATLTLEKINDIAKEHPINRDMYIKIDEGNTNNTLVYMDTSSVDGHASYFNYIKKMFLVRDNAAYNYAYDFLDQFYFNERIHKLGYTKSWFLHKLDHYPPQNSRQTNKVTFFRNDVKSYYIDIIHYRRHVTTMPFYEVYTKEGQYNSVDYYSKMKKINMGRGHVTNDGLFFNLPMDFTYMNRFSLEDMHSFLKSIIFPETQKQKLNLSDDDYVFLYKYMSMYPKESDFPNYDGNIYPHNYAKYILGDKLSPSVKVFNNSGKDYGFIVDNAYVIDTQNKVEFLLTIMVKCNRDDIYGEQYYEYEKIGIPVIRKISDIIHKHEIGRKKKSPDFSDFLNKLH